MATPPTRGARGSGFGMRVHPIDGKYRMHYGEDGIGAGNYSPVTGNVVYAGWDNTGHGFGWCVGIRESANPSVIWWVAHFGTSSNSRPFASGIGVGASVTQGSTYLGPSGTTGAAKGKHAHTERRVGGTARPGSGTATDPRAYYGGTAGGEPEPFPEEPEIIEKNYNQEILLMSGIRYHRKPAGATPEQFGIFGEQVPASGTFPGGYNVSANIATGVSWGRMYGRPDGGPWTYDMTDEQWENLKTEAAFRHQVWLAEQISIAASATLGSPPSELPTKADLGQALTSTVALINDHADDNKDEIIAAIPTGASGPASYDLSLSIDEIPGTATGTATSN